MASAFSVCALVENWRVIVPHGPGGNEAHGIDIKDPGWYVQEPEGQLFEGDGKKKTMFPRIAGKFSFCRLPAR